MVFSFSVALAYILTNIDGLFAFLALASGGRYRQVLTSFLVAQALVISGAYALGAGAAFVSPQKLGYLGLVPVFLGVVEIWRGRQTVQRASSAPDRASSLMGAAAMFLALSTDTFVLMSTFFADTRQDLDRHVLFGGLLATACLVVAATALLKGLKPSVRTEQFLKRLAPFVMIAAGLYILFDTATDTM